MAKLHVELDGPLIKPGAVIMLKDGQPLNCVASLSILLAAGDGGPEQVVSLSQLTIIDGQAYQSDVTHTIRKATISLEYVEA